MNTMPVSFAAAAVTFVLTVILAKAGIPVLKSAKMGQKILEIGPRWHKSKEGTPTMGGLFFLLPILLFGCIYAAVFEPALFVHLGFLAANGVIGFIDDLAKFTKKQNAGLTPRQKLILQFGSAAVYAALLLSLDLVSTTVSLPFGVSFTLPTPVYGVLAAILTVFTVNAVNLTDGIDGLASTVTAVVMILLAFFAYREVNEGCFFLGAVTVGGTLGFLVYNFHPARVFMGDTGSLFLGAAVAAAAFMLDKPFLLIFSAFLYYIEAISVMIQVASFKLTGKRVFRMTPIHHHFEMGGWGENKIVLVFSLVALAASALGVWLYLY